MSRREIKEDPRILRLQNLANQIAAKLAQGTGVKLIFKAVIPGERPATRSLVIHPGTNVVEFLGNHFLDYSSIRNPQIHPIKASS